MDRIVFFLLCVFIFSCKDDDAAADANTEFTRLSKSFKVATLPFELKEEDLASNKDTGTSVTNFFTPHISDTIQLLIKSKSAPIKYFPLAKVEVPDQETYFIIKAISGNKHSALIAAYTKDKKFAAVMPFLIFDDDNTTKQTSVIDEKFNISRNTVRKKGIENIGEGKNVFAFDRNTNNFSWIITDMLDESTEVINPIDTLSSISKLSGDYTKNKNLVSIRDGRHENQLIAFIHFETEDGCTGELKGDFILTSGTTAEYRQAGDPCALKLTFTTTSVTLSEVNGCGNYRGLNCKFSGTYTKKKPSTTQNKKVQNR